MYGCGPFFIASVVGGEGPCLYANCINILRFMYLKFVGSETVLSRKALEEEGGGRCMRSVKAVNKSV